MMVFKGLDIRASAQEISVAGKFRGEIKGCAPERWS
jgi:hypothetical protein